MVQAFLPAIRRWVWPALGVLALLLAVLVWLSPAERTLGQTVKLVYVHGALVRTAVVMFAASLPVNLVALWPGKTGWRSWGKALTLAAMLIWLAHTLFSMVTTYAAWGIFIAWYEPRTRFTFLLAGVGIIIVGVAYLIAEPRFTAVVFAVLAGLVLAMLPRLGFIQHPLDPIGASPSAAIQVFYGATVGVSVIMGGLLAVWLQSRLASGSG